MLISESNYRHTDLFFGPSLHVTHYQSCVTNYRLKYRFTPASAIPREPLPPSHRNPVQLHACMCSTMASCSSGGSSEEKKKSERDRNATKKAMLQLIRNLLKEFDVVGNRRWTEKYTLEQVIGLINALKASIRDHGGDPSLVPLPMASKRKHQCKCMSSKRGLRSLHTCMYRVVSCR